MPYQRRPLVLLLGLVGLLSVLVLYGRWRETDLRYQGRLYQPPLDAADLALTDMTGRPFRLSAAEPGVRLLFFGYTFCPDICPNTLTKVAAALALLDADERAQVQVLFVSVDPDRDTPQVLRDYLAPFGPEFLGLTGDLESLQSAAAAYFGTFYEEPEHPGLFSHSGNVYLLDRERRIPASYTDPFEPAALAHDLRLALR